MENIIQNQGFVTALSGILVVFTGLICIALVIHLFNKVFTREKETAPENAPQKEKSGTTFIKKPFRGEPVPSDHLAVITTAIEVYRKLYLDEEQSSTLFNRPEQDSSWKTGFRYRKRF